ncbi:MAG TPA: UDP-N-acetylmuramate dehydrogenase [Candidatus Limnocylindria bacterium]
MTASTAAGRGRELDAGLDRLDRIADERGIRLRPEAPLAPITTLRVGGSADRLAEPRTRDELQAVLNAAREAEVAWLVVGNGSNLVVADRGVRGLVIRNRARAVRIDGNVLSADAGAPMALLVKRATAAGLTGLEWGIAVPGTLGGAVWANAGAHGGEMRQRVTQVDAWDADSGRVHCLTNAACRFDYRESRFKHERLVVMEADLELAPDAPQAVAARVAEHQAQRAATQPLAEQNAGSVFRNPPGDFAGRLIEAAGLKGAREGGASISEQHANFIVTRRAGRAADVRRLAERVRSTVLDASGVSLTYEIEFVGDWEPDR